MLDAFIEFLDKIYYQGYAMELENYNPSAFSRQFKEFKTNHSLTL